MIEIINVLHLIFIDQIFWTVMIMLSFLILMGYFLFLRVGSFKGVTEVIDLFLYNLIPGISKVLGLTGRGIALIVILTYILMFLIALDARLVN